MHRTPWNPGFGPGLEPQGTGPARIRHTVNLSAGYDVAALRAAEFPWTSDTIYLNNASIGPLPERTRLVLDEFNRGRAAPHKLPDRELFAMLAETRETDRPAAGRDGGGDRADGQHRVRNRHGGPRASARAGRHRAGERQGVPRQRLSLAPAQGSRRQPWSWCRRPPRAGRTRRGCWSGSATPGCGCWRCRWCSSATATWWTSSGCPRRPRRRARFWWWTRSRESGRSRWTSRAPGWTCWPAEGRSGCSHPGARASSTSGAT